MFMWGIGPQSGQTYAPSLTAAFRYKSVWGCKWQDGLQPHLATVVITCCLLAVGLFANALVSDHLCHGHPHVGRLHAGNSTS